jgi:Carboxypeptidase regulatory-like domain
MGIKLSGFGGSTGKGCGCCGCSTTICVHSASCGSFTTNIVGATVQIKTGSTVIASGTTTGPLGCVVLTIPAAGSYTVVVAASGYPTNTSTKTLSCGGTTTITFGITDVNSVCCKSLVPIPLTVFWTVCGVTITLTFDTSSSIWLGGTCGFPATTTISTGGAPCHGTAPAAGTTSVTIAFTCANVNPAANTITILASSAGGISAKDNTLTTAIADCVASNPTCPTGDTYASPGTVTLTGTLVPLSLTGTNFLTTLSGLPAACAGQTVTLTS